jgi:hypothetical protein
MNNYIIVKLTEDQAKELELMCQTDIWKTRAYDYQSDIDDSHIAFVTRIQTKLNKELAKAKTV